MREFNPQLWFDERKLDYVPPHFTKCPTHLTNESQLWVITTLVGRYSIVQTADYTDFILENRNTIYFEDSKEAMMYELRWSGN